MDQGLTHAYSIPTIDWLCNVEVGALPWASVATQSRKASCPSPEFHTFLFGNVNLLGMLIESVHSSAIIVCQTSVEM